MVVVLLLVVCVDVGDGGGVDAGDGVDDVVVVWFESVMIVFGVAWRGMARSE